MTRSEFLTKTSLGLGLGALMPFPVEALAHETTRPSTDPKVVRAPEGRELNVLGDRMTVKLTGEDTDGQFTLIEENNEPGVGIPAHVHEHEDEVFRVVEGELEMHIGDETVRLGRGDTAFGPRGVPHAWRVVGDGPAKVDLSVFPAGLEAMFEELAQLPAGPPDLERVGRICGKYGVRFV